MKNKIGLRLVTLIVSINAQALELAATVDFDSLREPAGANESFTSVGYYLGHELIAHSDEDLGLFKLILESEGAHTLNHDFGADLGVLGEYWFQPKWALGIKPLVYYAHEDTAANPIIEGSLRWQWQDDLGAVIEIGQDLMLAANSTTGTLRIESTLTEQALLEVGYSWELTGALNETARIRFGYLF